MFKDREMNKSNKEPVDLTEWKDHELIDGLRYQKAEGVHTRCMCECNMFSQRGYGPCPQCIEYEMAKRETSK